MRIRNSMSINTAKLFLRIFSERFCCNSGLQVLGTGAFNQILHRSPFVETFKILKFSAKNNKLVRARSLKIYISPTFFRFALPINRCQHASLNFDGGLNFSVIYARCAIKIRSAIIDFIVRNARNFNQLICALSSPNLFWLIKILLLFLHAWRLPKALLAQQRNPQNNKILRFSNNL